MLLCCRFAPAPHLCVPSCAVHGAVRAEKRSQPPERLEEEGTLAEEANAVENDPLPHDVLDSLGGVALLGRGEGDTGQVRIVFFEGCY